MKILQWFGFEGWLDFIARVLSGFYPYIQVGICYWAYKKIGQEALFLFGLFCIIMEINSLRERFSEKSREMLQEIKSIERKIK